MLMWQSWRRGTWTAISIVLLIVVSGMIGGCNVLGPAYAVASGPPKKPAEFILEDKPTLVFVDDRANVLSRRNLRRQIADRVSQDLMVNKAVTTTISPRDGLAVAQQESFGKPMSIDAIGRAVGAEQVIYVDMQAFLLSVDGAMPIPQARCAVKVIDTTNKVKVYPGGAMAEDARILTIAGEPVSTELYRSSATRRQIEDMLAEIVGADLATLFYESSPREPGRNLDPR